MPIEFNEQDFNPTSNMQFTEQDFAPQESFLDKTKNIAGSIVGASATAGALTGGGYLAGKGIQKAGNIFARVGANLSQKTLDTVKDIGYNKIKMISDAPGNYLANKVIPEARQNIIKSIVNFKGDTDVLDNLGFNPEEIKSITKIPKGRLLTFGSQINKNWAKMAQNLQQSTTDIGKKIDNVYNVAEKIGVDFSIPNTYGTMKSELQKYGLVDLQGNLTRELETITSPSIKNLAKTYGEIHAGIKGSGNINVRQYRNIINQLEGALGTEEKFNVPLYKTIKVLRSEGAKNINPSAKLRGLDIVKLNQEYSDNITLSNMVKKLDQVINDSPDKLESTFNKLRNDLNSASRQKYAKIYGENLLKDIDSISAVKDLFPEKTGGWTRWGSREIVKGVLRLKEGAKNIKSNIKQLPSKIGKIGQKGIKGLGPLGMVLDAVRFSEDPMAYIGSQLTGGEISVEEVQDIRKRYQEGTLTDEEERALGLSI